VCNSAPERFYGSEVRPSSPPTRALWEAPEGRLCTSKLGAQSVGEMDNDTNKSTITHDDKENKCMCNVSGNLLG
jgi:hypothetical protein